MTLQEQQVHPSPSMPKLTVHTERSWANSPNVFTSKHVSVKAGKENVQLKNRGRRSIFVVHKMTMYYATKAQAVVAEWGTTCSLLTFTAGVSSYPI